MRLGLGIDAYRATGGYDPSLQAVIDFANSQSFTLPTSTKLDQINTFIITLKNAGVWAKLDWMHFLALDNGAFNFGRINLVDPDTFLMTVVSTSPTLVENAGFQGNAAGYFTMPNASPSALHADASRKYKRDDACIGVWRHTLINLLSETSSLFGSIQGTNGSAIIRIPIASGSPNYGLNGDSVTSGVLAENVLGLLALIRNNSANFVIKHNLTGSHTITNGSQATLSATGITFMARNDGSPDTQTKDVLSFFFGGGALTDPEYTALYNAMDVVV